MGTATLSTPQANPAVIDLIQGQADLLADYRADVLAAIAGTGGGKTAMGMWYLADRMQLFPGHTWGVAEPTYQMLEKIILNSPDPERPDLLKFLTVLGFAPEYKAVPRIIKTKYGDIYLGSADRPDTMQGAAVRGYWLDEAGMMTLEAYQTAIQRVSFYEGQVLLTTTPYNRGWLKTEVWDKQDDDEVKCRRWRSIDNPKFPEGAYDRAKRRMSKHRHAMMYDASFERPEGMIYYPFDDSKHVVEPFAIPAGWKRYVGMDFGAVNTVALWIAEAPKRKGERDPRRYVYREYLSGGRTTREHAEALLKLSKGERIRRIVGGAPSEDQWRRDLREGGWYCMRPPIKDVEGGIDRVVGLHKTDNYFVFRNCSHYLAQKQDYRRKLDNNGLPTEQILDKEKYHVMDAERYAVSYITEHGACALEY